MADRGKWFAHVDMDAFYASVEILDDPRLRGLPVAVGGPARDRGVIAAASYEARRFGVFSAMPTAVALRRCPDLVLRHGRMDRYRQKSREVVAILREVAPRLETVSLDEAFLDLTGCDRLHGRWEAFALRLRRRIHQESGLWCSIGLGETRRIAKIGSDLRKPRGIVVVPPGAGRDFLAPLPVERLWGVGPHQRERLHRLGLSTIGEIAAQRPDWLRSHLGTMGTVLHEAALARESGEVEPERRAHSVSHEQTFARDLRGREALLPVLLELSGKVGYRLRRGGLCGRVVQLKVRDATFRTVTRRLGLPSPVATDEAIYRAAASLLEGLGWNERPIRLIGVGVHRVSACQNEQGELFPAPADRPVLEKTLDALHTRFGGGAVQRARTLLTPRDRSASWESTAWERRSAVGGISPGQEGESS